MKGQQKKIDKQLIATPRVHLTDRALSEFTLMMENDFTIKSKYFRVLISGKGCDGFTYSIGITDLKDDDFEIEIHSKPQDLVILMDPFAAFYLQECTIDFVQDLVNDQEGFVIINHAQEKYAGKFWKSAPEQVPPLTESET